MVRSRLLLWPAMLLSALFAACLVYVAWFGNLIYPAAHALPAPPALADGDTVNESLEERIARLKAELAKAACDADASVLGVPMSVGLLGRIDAATVLVLSPSTGSLSSGSGFFVTSRDILTDRDVVKNAAAGAVFVVSKALGRAVPARIIAGTGDGAAGKPDFALLRVEEAPAGVKPLQLSPSLHRLDNVVAAGFPGGEASMDTAYQAMIDGDTSKVGELRAAITRGIVMALPGDGATQLVTHSASVSSGSSGGPLVDACGRAVGSDIFIPSDGGSAQGSNFSLRAADAIRFLAAHGVTVAAADSSCGPAQAAAVAGAGQQQPDPAGGDRQ
jgi:S1-C subfamily serine protease